MTRFRSLKTCVTIAALTMAAAQPAKIQARQATGASAVTEEQIEEAVNTLGQAKGYNELVAALAKNRTLLGGARARTIVEQRLRSTSPNDESGRRLLAILGQLFADLGKETPEVAANRYLVRLIAMGSMTTGDTDQLQRLLFRYFEFSPKFTPDLIRPSLAEPKIDWPSAMPKLMTQFVEDWHTMGANEAARGFADAVHAAIDDPTGEIAKARDEALVGQWYATQRGISGEPEDTNLILTKNGVARTYVSTGGPQDFEGIAAGRWMTAGGALMIRWDDGQATQAQYQLSNGQLMWPALGVRVWIRR